MNNNKNTIDAGFLITVGALVAALFIVSGLSALISPKKETPIVFNTFQNIDIEAQSAVVYDVKNNKFLYEKNSLTPRPLASITKLMTALLAKKALGESSTVIITKPDYSLRPGEKFFIKQLIDLTLTSSSNVGAAALAAAASGKNQSNFPEDMNLLARQIGLKGLLFENPTGLDGDSANAGAYGTAQDVAKLIAYILKNDSNLISATRYSDLQVESQNKISHTVKNTNEALPFIPGLIGGKTGFTDLSGGNLAVTFDPGLGSPFVAVVLGSSEQGRFIDMRKLVAATLLWQEKPLQLARVGVK